MTGPSSGFPISGGICSLIWMSRSFTSARAKYTSTSSLKMSVTMEMPSLLTLRVSWRPGTPAVPRSIGCVICDSTSVADSAEARVTTCTWTLVRSGTASIASSFAA